MLFIYAIVHAANHIVDPSLSNYGCDRVFSDSTKEGLKDTTTERLLMDG